MKSMACSFAFLLCLIPCPLITQAQSKVKTINVTFTTIDVPGAGYTAVLGINSAGDMVGDYGQDVNTDAHGFEYGNGIFTYFDYPNDQNHTIPLGLNDSGLIVGYAGENPIFGFLYDGTNFTTLQDGQDSATSARGINNSEIVVGGAGTIYGTTGFGMLNGRYRKLKVPGTHVYVYGEGINNYGEIVGVADQSGFICQHLICTITNIPGASETQIFGVSDSGTMVGWYFDSQNCPGCAFAMKNGRFVSFSFPGAAFTEAYGINKSGQIVGAYTFDYQAYHGFVTNPITDSDFR
jgi:probable HAF family extracellular repeat protein